MNKNTFRLLGTILGFEALYIIFAYAPLISRIFSSASGSSLAIFAVILFVTSTLLLLVSGFALFFEKKWSLITIWLSLLLSLSLSTGIGHSWPSFVTGGFMLWAIDLIIAIFISIEYKNNKLLRPVIVHKGKK